MWSSVALTVGAYGAAAGGKMAYGYREGGYGLPGRHYGTLRTIIMRYSLLMNYVTGANHEREK